MTSTGQQADDGKPVLFVGNDINNTVEGRSWADLVKGLIHQFADSTIKCRNDDPFPLVYEQIYLCGLRLEKVTAGEGMIKREIADWVKTIQPNDIHPKIMGLDVGHVITTNYDLTLEKAADIYGGEGEKNATFRETKYSLFRSRRAGDKTVWHIHGDLVTPNSINLGYEQYSGYLQHMRDYVVNGKIRPKMGGPLMARLGASDFQIQSWIDLLFTRDVFIFGFRLDQVEMHLWWLLAYRARKLAEGKLDARQNRIVYFYPSSLLEEGCPAKPSLERRLEMLKAFEVETAGCDGEPGTERYYEKVLEKVRGKILKRGGKRHE